MKNYWKYLLDGGLVVLIIVLIWTGARRWMNNRNNDSPLLIHWPGAGGSPAEVVFCPHFGTRNQFFGVR
jgi:hypothetical protein